MRVLATLVLLLGVGSAFADKPYLTPRQEADEILASMQARLTQSGQQPLALSMDEIARFMLENPDFAQNARKAGYIRIMISRETSMETRAILRTELEALRQRLGLSRKIEVEIVPVDIKKMTEEAKKKAEAEAGIPTAASLAMPEEFKKWVREEMARDGVIHLPLPEGFEAGDGTATATFLRDFRANFDVPEETAVELIPFSEWTDKMAPEGEPVVQPKRTGLGWLGWNASRPFRFFFNAYKKPSREDVIFGGLTKGTAIGIAVATMMTNYAKAENANPLGMAVAIPTTVILDTYFGIYIGWWLQLLDNIGAHYGNDDPAKGARAQYWFLYANGVFWNGSFRTIHNFAGQAPQSIFSTDFLIGGVLAPFLTSATSSAAYRAGVHAVETGRWPSWYRRLFWQLKDFVMMMQGLLLQGGSFKYFLYGCAAERSMEGYAWIAGKIPKPVPGITIAPPEIFDSGWYKYHYQDASDSATPVPGRLFLERDEVRRSSRYMPGWWDRLGDRVLLAPLRNAVSTFEMARTALCGARLAKRAKPADPWVRPTVRARIPTDPGA